MVAEDLDRRSGNIPEAVPRCGTSREKFNPIGSLGELREGRGWRDGLAVRCCIMRAVGHWIVAQRFPSDVIAGMTLWKTEYCIHGSPSDVVVGKSHVSMRKGAFVQRRLRCRLRHGVMVRLPKV